jgi:nitrite reductase (NADH) small subunit
MTAVEAIPGVGVRTWVDVGPVAAFLPDRGVAALVSDHQVAVFVLGDGGLHAIDNHDPIAKANVLSRGIVGDRGGVPVVASPVFKQCFELATGRCLDDPDAAVRTHDVRVVDGHVQVRLAAAAGS